MKKYIILSLLMFHMNLNHAQAGTVPAKDYKVDLPQHALSFSLSDYMLKKYIYFNDTPFDKNKSAFIKGGVYIIARRNSDVKNMFGLLKGLTTFEITIKKREARYNGNISTIDGLEQYIKWWMSEANVSVYNFVITKPVINGTSYVLRKSEKDGILEIYSFPLDNDSFLEIDIDIGTYANNNTKADWINIEKTQFDELLKTLIITKKPSKL